MKNTGIFYNRLVYYIYDHLEYYIISIRYTFWSFGMLPPVLVFWTKKNLATLLPKKGADCGI
jgi:hypothetical protein